MLRRIYYVCSYTFNIPFSEMMNPEFLMAWVGQWDYSQYRWAPPVCRYYCPKWQLRELLFVKFCDPANDKLK